MEQLNRIELRGNVGNVRLQTVANNRLVARITVATNYAYKDREGGAVIETTWHTVNAWQGKGITDLNKITKGSKVYVCGRLRSQKFIGEDQQERTVYEVIPSSLVLLDEKEQLQCEF
ncbi:MAG: single-stranded DNA-binding protein [Bacteroidales bacterium]|nr:single-stranded DNA-binding protein [Bacteroidales bacterium]